MTHTILHIDSSPQGDRSVTRKLTAKTLAHLKTLHPDARIITRDLDAAPLPHLDGTILGAFFTPADKRSPEMTTTASGSDTAIKEVMEADTLVIGVPMFNFGIPSTLKAWIDHIVRAGQTFHYTASGPAGLVPAGKKVIIVSSRGGIYSDGPMKAFDHQEAYLRDVFGFIGLKDVSFVRAEGVAMGEDAVKAAMDTAESQIAAVAA